MDPPSSLGYVALGAGEVFFYTNNDTQSTTISGPVGTRIVLYDLDPNATQSDVTYVRGLNLIASRTDKGVVTYYHYNAHGDVVQLTDSTGALVKNYEYDAFGVEENAAEDDANPFRYCGEQFDAETGNYYLRARNYTPGVGRFTQEDPIRDGLNWYAYCAGNPVRYVDPSGMDPGDLFDSLDEAAIDAGNYLMALTGGNNQEMLAVLYRNAASTGYRYKKVDNLYYKNVKDKELKEISDNRYGFYISGEDLDERVQAVIHTHVFYDISDANREFSIPVHSSAGDYNDADFVLNQGIPLYLATPAGEIKVLEPDLSVEAGYTERLVSTESYVDSGYAFTQSWMWTLMLNRFQTITPQEIFDVYKKQPEGGGKTLKWRRMISMLKRLEEQRSVYEK